MKAFKFLSLLVSYTLLMCGDSYAVSSEKKTLLSNSALTSTTTGSWVCFPRQADDFVLYLKASNSAGTNPTLDVVVYDSDDETNVHTLDTFTQVTTVTSTQFKPQNSASVHPLKCLRAVATIGGTATPTYNVDVKVHYRITN